MATAGSGVVGGMPLNPGSPTAATGGWEALLFADRGAQPTLASGNASGDATAGGGTSGGGGRPAAGGGGGGRRFNDSYAAFRVIVVGNLHAGKRTLAARLRDALSDTANACFGQSGGSSGGGGSRGAVILHSRVPGAGIDVHHAEVRRSAASGTSSASSTAHQRAAAAVASSSPSNQAAVGTTSTYVQSAAIEVFTVDTPSLLRIVMPLDADAARRTVIVLALDVTDPLGALPAIRRWRDAVNDLCRGIATASSATDSSAKIFADATAAANARWTMGWELFGKTGVAAAAAAAADSSVGGAPSGVATNTTTTTTTAPMAMRLLAEDVAAAAALNAPPVAYASSPVATSGGATAAVVIAEEAPFALPTVILATKADLMPVLDRYDRQLTAAQVNGLVSSSGGGGAPTAALLSSRGAISGASGGIVGGSAGASAAASSTGGSPAATALIQIFRKCAMAIGAGFAVAVPPSQSNPAGDRALSKYLLYSCHFDESDGLIGAILDASCTAARGGPSDASAAPPPLGAAGCLVPLGTDIAASLGAHIRTGLLTARSVFAGGSGTTMGSGDAPGKGLGGSAVSSGRGALTLIPHVNVVEHVEEHCRTDDWTRDFGS